MSPEILAFIVSQAESFCAVQDDDEFCTDDYAGGNVDDAHELGERDGRTAFARELLDKLGITYQLPNDMEVE